MPDLTIGQLPNASQVDPSSLFVAEQSGNAVNVTGAQLLEFANVETAAQVQSATKSAQAAAQSAQKAQNASSAIQNLGVSAETVPPTSTAEVLKTVDPTSGTVTLEFQIPAGTPGPAGADGESAYSDAVSAGYEGTEEGFNSRLAQIDEMCLEPLHLATPAMGQTAAKGLLELYEIRGNTMLGGIPAYDAPVSMASVDSPLNLHFSGKNLIDLNRATAQSNTKSGVSYAIKNGEITLSGTCDNGGSNLFFSLFGTSKLRMIRIPKGTYTFSGCSLENYAKGVLLYLNVYNLNLDYISDKSLANTESVTFTLSEDALVQPSIRIIDGSNVDGVVLYPQLEVGDIKTDFETYRGSPYIYNTVDGIDIPLLGTDGQALEPLRMAYTGTSEANKTPCADRILRKNGLWCIERNTMQVSLTNVGWSKLANYMAPTRAGASIKPGVKSNFTLCTHFQAKAESSESSGVWTGSFIVIGNNVLPNGAATTVDEMAEFCAAQAETGTPVLVCTPMSPPVYEELHQDVQVLLNTLAVPGGVCSVWFEGDILPGADIGLPRGDYPNAGMEGAYRWLGELSSPLSPPTQDDLYAWALMQQRGGVFSANGDVTTKNVPEGGNLTGILSVTKQGEDVSMLVFGPTGKLHAANRMAGVWRGWSTLATQEQLDAKIGEIGTMLDAINGEVV